MDRFKWVIQLATLGLLIVAGYLVVQRGGLLAWSGVIAALLLLIKQRARPSRTDMFVVLGFTLLWTASWAAAWSYVRSTWESGEVVELSLPVSDEIQTARVWILDADGGPVMYYDAPPRIGEALLAFRSTRDRAEAGLWPSIGDDREVFFLERETGLDPTDADTIDEILRGFSK